MIIELIGKRIKIERRKECKDIEEEIEEIERIERNEKIGRKEEKRKIIERIGKLKLEIIEIIDKRIEEVKKIRGCSIERNGNRI